MDDARALLDAAAERTGRARGPGRPLDTSSEAQRAHIEKRWAPKRPQLVLAPPPFLRVAPDRPLSAMEEVVCILLGAGLSYREVGESLAIPKSLARKYAKTAALKIPGDLAAQEKCTAWARGATMDVLDGRALRDWLARTAVSSTVAP
jgi:hypothetical protein